MTKVPEILVDPSRPQSLVDQIKRLTRVANGLVGFGHPQDPLDDDGTTLAGASAGNHNGTTENIQGSWVELQVETLDAATTCHHHLAVPVVTAGEPNVRWLVFGFQHDGTGASATSGAPGAQFESGDTVNEDNIQLRFYAPGRTVDGDHPLHVTLFFIPAIRGVAE